MIERKYKCHYHYLIITRSYKGPAISEDKTIRCISMPLYLDRHHPTLRVDLKWYYQGFANQTCIHNPWHFFMRTLNTDGPYTSYEAVTERLRKLVGDIGDVSIHGDLEGKLKGEGMRVMYSTRERTRVHIHGRDEFLVAKWWDVVKVGFKDKEKGEDGDTVACLRD